MVSRSLRSSPRVPPPTWRSRAANAYPGPFDLTLVAREKALIVDLRTRALALKQEGVGVEKAGELLTAELKTRYPDWPITTVAYFVKSIYAE
jgi:hypothetical protein